MGRCATSIEQSGFSKEECTGTDARNASSVCRKFVCCGDDALILKRSDVSTDENNCIKSPIAKGLRMNGNP
ncbi:hypothetical protein AA0473_1595 [Acetobacter orleanensis NRIC 0473]|uniref:Uncharacterized protein n=1 Tax=Acetobacter orleanensis TaxID=104099 RepID=A0A4Y3TQ13_9PROT|nr:hypothetical protein Abol_011_039 [Acetobacter orleanensis JCM 7639]GBR27970.1 hypothetical protein AA0473_1595 [Acetobacter orleanensis NRIC 0473]GEB83120.1 hypothetical protein AOR01nite_15970 [Acetobacter orleanensis]